VDGQFIAISIHQLSCWGFSACERLPEALVMTLPNLHFTDINADRHLFGVLARSRALLLAGRPTTRNLRRLAMETT
jgi:hypothetical protein